MDITRSTQPEQPYLYVERETEYGPGIAAAMESGFGELFGFVQASGLQPQSMPMSVYLEMDPSLLRFRAAVKVSAEDAAKATGTIKADIFPAGDVMTVTHVGSYQNMSAAHQALWAHMAEHDIPGGMPTWEEYIDDPGDTPEAELRTQITRMIAES